MTTPRVHARCGKEMAATIFTKYALTPEYRNQPIWQCFPCEAWEPRDDWEGALPVNWDGRAWVDEADR